MGLFDKFKKKKEPALYWKRIELIGGATVGWYIKRILKDNAKDEGIIYLNEDAYRFAYGNMSDIVPPDLMNGTVSELLGAEEDGMLYFKIVY